MTIDDHTFAVIECRVPLWSEDEVAEGASASCWRASRSMVVSCGRLVSAISEAC
jgi:hypothetical protein